jgi:hypothetical protein
MRSSNDPITGLKNNILEWGVVEESELKAIDKEARHEVEVAVEEAKKSPEPSQETDMYTDSAFAFSSFFHLILALCRSCQGVRVVANDGRRCPKQSTTRVPHQSTFGDVSARR